MRVLITETYSVSATARLMADGHEIVTDREIAEAALIRSLTRVDKHFLDIHPQLRAVFSATSGFDHIDWRETEKRGILAAHTPEANPPATAELTIGLMIAAERDLLNAAAVVRANGWRESLKRPRGLGGYTLGVIGFGRVGRRVARIAEALAMNVVVYDPYIDDFGSFTRIGFTELLRTSDYVTLHVPLTRETLHLINEPTLNEMQEHALLINACRGPVVDENDLLAALDGGRLAGAAMDVIEREPPPKGHRSRQHPKLLLTPHIGAFTERAWEDSSMSAVQKLEAFARGEPVADTLPLSTPWFDLRA